MIDVDKTYDPTARSVKDPSQLMSLDEHREIELAKIQQPGFGLPKVSPEVIEYSVDGGESWASSLDKVDE